LNKKSPEIRKKLRGVMSPILFKIFVTGLNLFQKTRKPNKTKKRKKRNEEKHTWALLPLVGQ